MTKVCLIVVKQALDCNSVLTIIHHNLYYSLSVTLWVTNHNLVKEEGSNIDT